MARTKAQSHHSARQESTLDKKTRKRKYQEAAGSRSGSLLGGALSSSSTEMPAPPAKKNKNKTTSVPIPDMSSTPLEADSTSLPSAPGDLLDESGRAREGSPFSSAKTRTTTTTTTTTTTPLLAELSEAYEVTMMNVISSSSLQKKATRALEELGTWPVEGRHRDRVVVLQAKGMVVGKMVSVVEIVKREVGGKGGRWFQYNAIGELVEEAKGREKGRRDGAGEGVGREESEGSEEESFESMKTPFERAIEGKAKVRAVPVMTVYLSRIRIDSLKKAYGEQTNGLEKK